MKWIVGWIIVFVISWGLGTLFYGIAYWRKNSKATEIVALILFGLPVVFLLLDIVKDRMIVSNYHAAVEEVKALCAKDGGDKIYKTVDNVQGVFQMRARQPKSYRDEKGNYHQWMSDQYGMEDPYGDAEGDSDDISGYVGMSSIFPDAPPIGKQGYWFIEQQPKYGSSESNGYRRNYLVLAKYSTDATNPILVSQQINVSKLKSRYGYLAEDLTTKELRDKWIGAGRIKIIDLQTNEVLAERKGYFRAPGDMFKSGTLRWAAGGHSVCPFPPNNAGLIRFLHSVLKPPQDFPSNEQLELIAKE